MFKRSFVGLLKPRLEYTALEDSPSVPKDIPSPKQLTFLMDFDMDSKELAVPKQGDAILAGNKMLSEEQEALPVVFPATGTVAAVAPFTGDFGRSLTSVTIDCKSIDEASDQEIQAITTEISLDDATACFETIPGAPCLTRFSDPDKKISTIVVMGVDSDVLVTTNQYIVYSKPEAIKTGIQALKNVTGVQTVVMVVPSNLTAKASGVGAEIRMMGTEYPSALPHAVMKDILNLTLPAGKDPEDLGVCFMTAEAVASIGAAVESGSLPNRKTITVIAKDGSSQIVTAAVGTPISGIFNACNITINDRDRVVIGGPFTGSTIYSEDHPVCPSTDAIIVQDAETVSLVSDYPCINCGECIRICPAKMPVNLLVRYLEAGQYEEAAARCDLDCCFGCGLCSFVCVSKIPIFQYIKLAQYELDRAKAAEQYELESVKAAEEESDE